MKQRDLKIPAGSSEDFGLSGNYIRIKSASIPVRIQIPEQDVDATLEEGDSLELLNFSHVIISHESVADQTVTVGIGNGTAQSSSRVAGSITLDTATGFTQAAVAVGLASGLVLAANTERRFLMLQNKSAAASVWVNLAGAAASAANGFLMDPGAVFILDACVPAGEINAIASAAADLLAIEG